MNCETSSQLISRSLDNDLSDAEQAALREHLAQCPACEKLERDQRSLDAAVESLPGPDLPPDYSRRLREEVWRKVRMPERRPVALAFRIAAIAAILMLSTAVVLLARRLNGQQAEVRQLTRALETARSPAQLANNGAAENGSAEQVQTFGPVHYLGGAGHWMTLGENQIRIGLTGARVSTVTTRDVVLVTVSAHRAAER